MLSVLKRTAFPLVLIVTSGSAIADPVELTRTLYEKLNAGVPHSEIVAYFSEDYVDHNRMPQLPAALSDYEAITGFLGQLNTAFEGRQYEINFLDAVGDDAVIVHWTMTSTHTGELFGLPATGNPVRLDGMDILRYERGQIVEHWHIEQLLTLMSQLSPS